MISCYKEYAASILECGSTSCEKYSSIMATLCPGLPVAAVIKHFENPEHDRLLYLSTNLLSELMLNWFVMLLKVRLQMNKSIDYYLSLPYRMEVIPDTEEGGFTAWYPDLPGCITCSETIEGAVANAVDAKKAWIEAALEQGISIYDPEDASDYSGQFKLRMPKSLHRDLAIHAKREGISMNQYCLYLLARNDALK